MPHQPRVTRPGRSRQTGLTLIEVSLAIVIAASFLLVSAGAFSSSLRAVSRAERVTDGALFLQSVMEDVSALEYDNLLVLNGNRIFENATFEDSNYVVDLEVFLAQANLVQVTAVMIDTRVDDEVGRLVFQRARR